MSLFARRVYYLSAFLIFIVAGPLIVAWTAGYRWSYSQSGFIRTGALTVTSEPRAAISLNGVNKGATPFRASHLTPGTYIVELTKTGFGSWRQEVAITANVALTIGPVMLFPPQFAETDLTTDGSTLISADGAATFSLTANGQQWTAQQIWPTKTSETVVLPWLPTWVNLSRSGQTAVWQHADQAIVVIKNQADNPWTIPAIDRLAFDPSSEAVFYGLQGASLVRYDSLTRQRDALALSDSFTVINDTLWFTQRTAEATTILRQPAFGQHVPDSLLTLPGQWEFVAGPSGTLLIRNATTRELATMTQTFGLDQLSISTLGPADAWWWTDASQPPLWLNGTDLMTLNDKKVPQLIDRLSAAPLRMGWIVPGHILWSMSDHQVSITSISSRQGRGVLLEKTFGQLTSLLGINIGNRTVVVGSTTIPGNATELRW